MKRVIALITIPLVVAGCGSGNEYTPKPTKKIADISVKTGEEADIMPLKVGNQWVYVVETGQGTSELTLKVTEVTQEGDATLAVLTVSSGTNPPTETLWRVDKTGIYQVSDGSGSKFDPPQVLIPFPLDTNKVVEYAVTGPFPFGGGSGSMRTSAKYIGPQHADIEGDRVASLAVESLTTWTTENGQAASRGMTWWTPGIGFVRQRQEVGVGQNRAVITMRLKSHSFK